MNGTEIITFLSNNFPTVMTAVSSVTGALFTAIFLRHNTSATEFEKIKVGQFKEVADTLLASGKMTYTEYYKANNFLQVAKKADEYYSEMNHDQIKTTYDFDWFVRFYEAVGNISNEEMQELWAKILAGEIAKPTSFSLKTIDTLRNISKTDAELFVKICSHSFNAGDQRLFLPRYDGYLDNRDIRYVEIMKLNEQGLIFNDGTISLNINITSEPKMLFTNKELLMTISTVDGKEVSASISQYPFTEVGREIASLFQQSASDEDFIEFGREVSEQNKNYAIGVHKVISWDGNSVQYDRKNLLRNIADENELVKQK